MITESKNDSKGLLKTALLNSCIYVVDSREICSSILELISEKLINSTNSMSYKNESHPPIQYYKNPSNTNITYNINININTIPPKKPWDKFIDIVIKIVKLITLFLGLSSLGDSDHDSSDNNLRLQLA